MFSHVKFAHLPVRDQDRAIAFYRDKVGLKVATDAPYRDGLRWIELAVGESPTICFSQSGPARRRVQF
ncbi:VOC family protein [Mesorhizobium sp.]|uniref:VOC family protein n=1 Tax=Mesorhizobium sp. TaxID=1871066 RepID=UPI00257E5942|nr:VOC family protein [Mesorhizobium sp.]